jgi:hypothetical protein
MVVDLWLSVTSVLEKWEKYLNYASLPLIQRFKIVLQVFENSRDFAVFHHTRPSFEAIRLVV